MKHPSLRHPGRWIWLFLLAPAVIGLVRLRLDVEVLDLLPPDLRVVEGLKLYQKYFTNARQLLMTVRSPDAEAAERAAREIAGRLRSRADLVTQVDWEPPWLEHPEQAAELVAYLWFNQPPAVFAGLTNRLAPEALAAALAAAREELSTSLSPEELARLSYDPFGLTRLPGNAAGAAPSPAQGQELFSSDEGRFRILYLQATSPLNNYRQCAAWLEQIQSVAQGALAAANPGAAEVSLGYTGRPAFVAETAAGMQTDMIVSVGGTAVIIAILFWLAHRRLKPMLWLLALLAITLGATLALGGLIYGTINVVSVGFAAILLGLSVDYAVVHYQEALAHPNLSIGQIRHAIAPSIFWAAFTTISAFLVLNFGGLPGLGQFGTLVALGVALAAAIMIFEYLPPLFPNRNQPYEGPAMAAAAEVPPAPESAPPVPRRRAWAVYGATVASLAAAGVVLGVLGWPKVDATANALRPVSSSAFAVLEDIQTRLSQQREPLWLIVGGQTVGEVAGRLDAIQATLRQAQSNHWVSSFTLPSALWPRPEFQEQNRATARVLAQQGPALRAAARAGGFNPGAVALSERMLDTWQVAANTSGVFWPTNHLSRWIFEKLVSRAPGRYFAFGLINPTRASSAATQAAMAQLERALPRTDVWLSGWELLGRAIFERVRANLWKLVAPMIVLVLLSLLLAFRRGREIGLSLAALLLSGVCLLTVMRLAHWSWNLLNLMAIPLVLGTGVDYSIFMQLALRRYAGDRAMAQRAVGRALLLCGGTTIAAFASLAWSSNAGMASLGEVCAVGIAFNVLIAVFLAPVWWSALLGSRPPPRR